MSTRRVRAFAASLCLAGVALMVAGPAHADDSVASAELAETALAAAAAADQAFVDAEWATVQAQIDAFHAAYDELAARVDAARLAVAAAEAVEDEAAAELGEAQADYDALVAVQQDFARARQTMDSARDSLDAVSDTLFDMQTAALEIMVAFPPPSPEFDAALEALAFVQSFHQAAASAHIEAERVWWGLYLQLRDFDADAIVERLAAAEAEHDAAVEASSAAQAGLDALQALLDDLAEAAASVADRTADLADLEHVRSVVVWTLGADNDAVRAGDLVKLNFTVPNSQLFDLTDAQVTVESPAGVTPECDIADGVVAAGDEVACTAEYTPTAADATAGKVVFEVTLRGYIPLGPGNPRAQAVTRTLIETSQTLEVQVAAALAPPVLVPDGEAPGEDTPGAGTQDSGTTAPGTQAPGAKGVDTPSPSGGAGGELSSSGADTSAAGFALLLVAGGAGLLLMRRRVAA